MPVPSRSPICPKALTLAELRELPQGTQLILFCWTDQGSKRHYAYHGIKEAGRRVLVCLSRNGHDMELPAGDLGLESYDYQLPPHLLIDGWNASNVLVLPEDVGSLPNGLMPMPEPERC